MNVDGTVEEFIFNKDPLEGEEDLEKLKNLRWVEVPLYKFNLLVIFELEPAEDKINKK